ncbi:hypothetical protein RHOSPDRAFT_23807, partial [Rhodotorula sp. JG-1b]
EEWSKRLADVNVSKDDLNALVANYLFTEGYLSAAENFAREAGLATTATAATPSSLNGASSTAATSTPSYDVESIKTRMEVRRAVLKGDVEVALDKVVDLDLEILDLDPSLHFHLLQQHLIELIRVQEIPTALAFAQNELAPLAEEHPRFLKELEKTMALLAFELPTMGGADPAGEATASSSLPPMPAAISSLLDPSQRLRTAWELNAAILNAQGHASEPKLPGLMAIMNWGEGLLNEKGVDWPRCACGVRFSLPREYGLTFHRFVTCSTGDLHELLASETAPSSTAAAATNGGDAAMAL